MNYCLDILINLSKLHTKNLRAALLPKLTPEAILDALDHGDFYSTTGVNIKDIKCNGKRIKVEIEPQKGVKYLTEYIGTFPGFSAANTPTLDADGNEITNTTNTYSPEIGRVLASSNNTRSEYKFTGDELYVRVKIMSINPIKVQTLRVYNP